MLREMIVLKSTHIIALHQCFTSYTFLIHATRLHILDWVDRDIPGFILSFPLITGKKADVTVFNFIVLLITPEMDCD
jgi:hypothetical protein